MEFDPKCMEALGDAALLLDGDTVYIYAPTWMIAIPQADLHISEEVMEILYDCTRPDASVPFLADWGILAADVISAEEVMFLPHKGHRSKLIEIGGIGFRHVSVEQCRSLLDAHSKSIWGEVTDLSAIYEAGQAEPIYSERSSETVEFAKSSKAVSYTFEYNSPDYDHQAQSARRVLRLDAAKFDALCDLGFQVTAPIEYSGCVTSTQPHSQPPAGLYIDPKCGPPIVGILMAEAESRKTESDDGRSLLVDAAQFCWLEEYEVTAILSEPESYPVQIQASASNMAMNAYCPAGLSLAIGWMRWNGYPEDVINEVYDSGRMDAYHQQLRDLEHLVDRALVRVWDDPKVSDLEAQRMLTSLEDCQAEIELLCETLSIKVNYEPIWDLRAALEQHGGAA